MRGWRFAVAALLGLLMATPDADAQSLTPSFPGRERYFSVSREPFDRRGEPYLRGNIVSGYSVTATRVQILVDTLDASKSITAQWVERLGSSLPGFSSPYFEVPIRERGAAYRVSIYAFDFVQSARIASP